MGQPIVDSQASLQTASRSCTAFSGSGSNEVCESSPWWTGQSRPSPDTDKFPSWSPTDHLIEFTRASGGAYDIFSIRPDGTNLRRLTMAPGNDAHGVWSPDGKHIVFSSARLGFKDESPLYDPPEFQPYGELFIMNFDGSGQRPLTDNKDEDGTPAWQPLLRQK
jgi:Tol biopolymer transport system component